MKKVNRLLLFMVSALFSFASYAQVTTSAMNGRVLGNNNEALPAATVLAVHEPTGSQFGTVTDVQGYYRLPNMNVGGPYTLKISYVGYDQFIKENIYLNLGQTVKQNINLSERAQELEAVQVIASKRGIIDGNRTGAETVVREESISVLPSITRDMNDFTRLTPQATVSENGGISIAGINNRYNSISIDGAVNNDVFGLAANGQNGGQTGGTPISMDAIEQFQIVLAPYDVRQNGFAGAAINAVTRSGKNRFDGSVYSYYRNETLAGLTPTDDETVEREKLDEYSAQTYGMRLGGPIVKNKLFFFINAEYQHDQTPQPFSFDDFSGSVTREQLTAFEDKLQSYGYDPGGFENNTRELLSQKLLARFDWNINKNHKLTFRHSYTNNESTSPSRSSSYKINYFNNGRFMPNVTNSTAFELKSNFDRVSNNLTIGFTSVRDDRDPLGGDFPSLRIDNTVFAGSEPFSTANQLDQDILTISDNLSIYRGSHTITIGTHNEYSNVYNLFMRMNFGEYRYDSMEDFLEGNSATQIEHGYSLVDDITGDGSAAAAEFSMFQFGIFAQDEWEVQDNLKLTFGLRVDMPMFLDDPIEDENFNMVTIPLLEDAGWDLMGAKAGQMPKTQLMWSPRFGFNYDVFGDKELQIRGGVGVFTSRIPLVWPGGSYTNNGLTIGGLYHKSKWGQEIPFNPNWDEQPTGVDFGSPDAIPSGQMDLFAENFKMPQVLRANLAVDKKLPWGIIGTVEGLYTKTLNNVLYYNLNVAKDSEFNLEGTDNRPYYSDEKLDETYTRIMLGTNTNEGYTYNVTAQIQKPFENGLTGSFAYTFGRAMALNDGTSSQNSSQWKYMESVNGINNLELSYSDFDLGHRVVSFLSYRFEYLEHAATTISLVYNGQSGQRYSYIYDDDGGNLNGTAESDNNLIYIPQSSDEIELVDIINDEGAITLSAEQQWLDLEEFIGDDSYLSEHKGEYAERNGARLPFNHILDLRLAQDFFIETNGTKHKLQLTLDVFNFTNMINKNWGRRFFILYNYNTLIEYKGMAVDGKTPQFIFEKPESDVWNIDDSGVLSSRWQAQIGVRYTF